MKKYIQLDQVRSAKMSNTHININVLKITKYGTTTNNARGKGLA